MVDRSVNIDGILVWTTSDLQYVYRSTSSGTLNPWEKGR